MTTKEKPFLKNLGILRASLILYLIVTLKNSTWAHFRSSFFWTIALASLLCLIMLCILLARDLFRWTKNDLKEPYRWFIFLSTLLLLVLTIEAMR
jgi:hypothetical protein